MKPAVLIILAITCLFIAGISCTKNNTAGATTSTSNTALLVQASWKIQSLGIDTDRNGTVDRDITSSIPACKLDNTYSFYSNNTGLMDEAALKCAAQDPQTRPFSWLFKNNETVLSGTFNFTNGDATIMSISAAMLKIAYDDNFGTATSYHLIAALQH